MTAAIVFGLAGIPAATTGSVPTQTFAITAAQVTQLKAGQMYLNVHSTVLPGGEIRGQIVDNVSVACSYTIVAGNPKRIDFTVVDTGSGLSSFTFPTLDNANVTPPPFTVGTNAPVAFSVTKAVQSLPSRVSVLLTDDAGNQSNCV